jgi:hypothetical protein
MFASYSNPSIVKTNKRTFNKITNEITTDSLSSMTNSNETMFFCKRRRIEQPESSTSVSTSTPTSTTKLESQTVNKTGSFSGVSVPSGSKPVRTTDLCIVRKRDTNVYKIMMSYDMKRQLGNYPDLVVVDIIPLFNAIAVYQKLLTKIQKNIMFYMNDWMRIHGISDDMMKRLVHESVVECN